MASGRVMVRNYRPGTQSGKRMQVRPPAGWAELAIVVHDVADTSFDDEYLIAAIGEAECAVALVTRQG